MQVQAVSVKLRNDVSVQARVEVPVKVAAYAAQNGGVFVTLFQVAGEWYYHDCFTDQPHAENAYLWCTNNETRFPWTWGKI